MRFPFLRSKTDEAARPKAKVRSGPADAFGEDPNGLEAARTQARRRLVGALVLLVIGVLGFPVLFETQPRPLPLDTPMVVAHRESTLAGPSASGLVGKDRSAPTPVANGRAAAGQPLPPDRAGNAVMPAASSPAAAIELPARPAPTAPTAPPAPAKSPKSATGPAEPAPPKPSASVLQVKPSASALPVKPTASVVPVKPAAASPSARATAPAPRPIASAPTPRPAQAPPPAEPVDAAGRWVVQAGAYTEAAKLREARARIEQLGLKTYTQVVETDKGSRTRVRVGPYVTRAEAEGVAGKVRQTGLQAAVLAL